MARVLPPDAEIGKRQSDCACPIARHLFAVENFNKEYTERRTAHVTKFSWHIGMGETHKLQSWARKFVAILDDSTGTTGAGTAVTAQEALDLLSSL